jgi:hypothetical protein
MRSTVLLVNGGACDDGGMLQWPYFHFGRGLGMNTMGVGMKEQSLL